MHELSIALGIIDVAAQEAENRGAVLRAVHVKIGALSGVVARALVSAWELAREETPAAEADLVIVETPVVVRCDACGAESVIGSILSMQCARCGAPTGNVISGRELEVVALELESDVVESPALES